MSQFTVKTIIHGHFYQPPREDPWLDYIENQPSAYPDKNWNVRITGQCYAPNCFSRVLDHHGMIKNIINNYRYISFNFGPTLLNWLEKEDKEIHDLIIEADRQSIAEHNGHGNAIAQVYNHVLMPLQSYEDKKTQIIWGLRDFENRFGRKSEGLWLSETGIDYETVDLLIDFGISYVILSPIQAQGYRKLGDHDWTDVSSAPISTTRPYKIIREHGEIAVFYFDRNMSNAVSFDHLLRDSNKFAEHIMGCAETEDDVVIVASDGEVYGHHEPFGDMCLAHLIHEYQFNQNRLKFYNFGEYLELFPPQYETSLWLGEDGKGSSWSCVHGVGRWYRHCGCHTGGEPGWNQKWRTPFRHALDVARSEIDSIFHKELADFVDDPWKVRNDYIEYIMGGYNSSKLGFLIKHLKNKKLDNKNAVHILSLLESQKYAMFMYTSCAWFFTELTGIETVQNLKYAYKAIWLLKDQGKHIFEKLEQALIEAKSNIAKFHNGKWIMDNWIYPYVQDLSHIANNFIALLITHPHIDIHRFRISNSYQYQDFEMNVLDHKNSLYEGKITVLDRKGHFHNYFCFVYYQMDRHNYQLALTGEQSEELNKLIKDINNNTFHLDNYSGSDLLFLSENDLIHDIKRYIIDYKCHDEIEAMFEQSEKILMNLGSLLLSSKNMHLELQDVYKSLIRFGADSYFYNLAMKLDQFPNSSILKRLFEIFELINSFYIPIEAKELKDRLAQLLYDKLKNAGDDIESNIYKEALMLIEFCHKVKLKIETSRAENIILKLINTKIPELIKQLDSAANEEDKVKFMLQYRHLIILGNNFNINTDKAKKIFFENIELLDLPDTIHF